MRRRPAEKRRIRPDSNYQNVQLAKFINNVMLSGKRTAAQKIVYGALEEAERQSHRPGLEVFKQALRNATPGLEVRSRRVGGATYQVPVEVKVKRSQTLALRWLLEATRKRKNKTMSDKLINELMDAYQKKGAAMKKREDTHRMAESNKAFAHYRW